MAQKKLTNIEDIGNQNEIPTQKDDIKEDIESNSSDSIDQKIRFTDFDHKKLIASFFLELTQIYGTTTEAFCCVSDKVMHILSVKTKSGMQCCRQYSQKCHKPCCESRKKGTSYLRNSIW